MHTNIIFVNMSLNQSADLYKMKEQETELTPQHSFTEELSLRSTERFRKKYGNMKVILETDRILITLGSDYICFIASFTCFLIAGIYLIIEVDKAFQSLWIKIINFALVLLQLLSYLAIAVSNPGIVLEQTLNSTQDKDPVQRTCKICNIRMAKKTYHCKYCDVCIRDYDHHCPWTSKCIGGSNLRRFYVFVSITPLYLVYYMIMVLVVFAILSSEERV